jgi:putative acetyltransferase
LTSLAAHPSAADLGRIIDIRPAGIDDHASLRYLHAKALATQAAASLSDAEIEAFVHFTYSPDYADHLMAEDVLGAWIGGELAGSASWHAAREDRATARIGSLFVRHPRFGIGRRLLAAIEARAAASGFTEFATWTTGNAVPFFQSRGYEITSRGMRTLSNRCALPVTFMRKITRPLGA